MAKNKLKKLKARAEDQTVPSFPEPTPEQQEMQRVRQEINTKAATRLNAELDKEQLNLEAVETLLKITGYGYY